jgi:hypothetical protein
MDDHIAPPEALARDPAIHPGLRKLYANVCTYQAIFCCTTAHERDRLRDKFAEIAGPALYISDMENPKATLRDVAKAAGVHISTASHRITPDVVERVRTLAGKLGYRVNAFASSLRTKRSNAIGILVPDPWNPGFPAIVAGV